MWIEGPHEITVNVGVDRGHLAVSGVVIDFHPKTLHRERGGG